MKEKYLLKKYIYIKYITTGLFNYFSFINDLTYREAVENSVNYNTRLCIERRLRMPFLDTQTGIISFSIFIFVIN